MSAARRARERRLVLLASLYLSQGLPFGFFTQALPALLRREGHSLGQIGLTSLLAVPWALKFLWAPWVDRFGSARFGHRKSWIVPLQLGAVAVVLSFALIADPAARTAMMLVIFLLNAIAATQDIATDGLAVDILAPAERGLGNGVQVAGYRVGMILGGGVLLMAYDALGFRLAFVAMAAMLAAATVPIALTDERAIAAARASGGDPSSLESESPGPMLRHFFWRPGAWNVIGLIGFYKFGDAMASGMIRPLMIDRGFELADVGAIVGTVGFGASLCGAMLGGLLVERVPRRGALVFAGALQVLAVLAYAWVAIGTPTRPQMIAAVAAEHLLGGIATASLFTVMMDFCARRHAASDYTVQASVVVVATGVAGVAGGFMADRLGYHAHFLVCAVIASLAIGWTWFRFPTASEIATLRGEP